MNEVVFFIDCGNTNFFFFFDRHDKKFHRRILNNKESKMNEIGINHRVCKKCDSFYFVNSFVVKLRSKFIEVNVDLDCLRKLFGTKVL